MTLRSPEEYRRRAQRALDLATNAKEPSTAEALRRVAADYESMAKQLETHLQHHKAETGHER
jgi:hypothetical protein